MNLLTGASLLALAKSIYYVELVSVTYYISLYVGAKRLVFHLSPRDGHVIIVSGCLILTAVNLIVLIRARQRSTMGKKIW